MQDDGKLLYDRMVDVVQGQDAEMATNAAMNLIAALIVGFPRPSWKPRLPPRMRAGN